MYQPLIKFHPYPAIITQVLPIFVEHRSSSAESSRKCKFRLPLHSPFTIFELKLEDTFARLNKIKASFVLLRPRLFVYL